MVSGETPMVKTRLFEDEYHARIAIPALRDQMAYVESFSDEDEKHKASFDSLGFLKGVPCFLEVKLDVRSGEVKHIGEKLNEAFQILGDLENHSVFAKAMQNICSEGETPLFGVIARSYSDRGLPKLLALLRAESDRLQFAWTAWRCSVEGDLSILDEDRSRVGKFRKQISLPKAVKLPKPPRKKPPEIAFHAENAAQNGAGELFAEAINQFSNSSAKLASKSRFVSGLLHGVNIRIYGRESNKDSGLLMGINKELDETIRSLGFQVSGFGDFGFPNFRISKSEQIIWLINALANRARAIEIKNAA